MREHHSEHLKARKAERRDQKIVDWANACSPRRCKKINKKIKTRKQLTSDRATRRMDRDEPKSLQERSVQQRHNECRRREPRSTAAFKLLQQRLDTLHFTTQQHRSTWMRRGAKCQTKRLERGFQASSCVWPASSLTRSAAEVWAILYSLMREAPKLWQRKQVILLLFSPKLLTDCTIAFRKTKDAARLCFSQFTIFRTKQNCTQFTTSLVT